MQGERRLARFQTNLQVTDSTEDETNVHPNIDLPVQLSETEETDLFSILSAFDDFFFKREVQYSVVKSRADAKFMCNRLRS